MRTTILGRSGLEVSKIAFGTWQLGGDWGAFDEDTAFAAIHHARDLGVNFFDTAQAYGRGRSEVLLGRALRHADDVVIATKGGINPRAERPRDSRRAWLTKGLDESLRNLGVEHIDLYQVHWPDPDTPAAEVAGLLQEFVDAGKVRHVGVSNYTAEQLRAFDRTRPVETLQPPYHLFRRGLETDPLPYAREHDIGVFVYSPLGSGLLTGALTPDTTFEATDWRSKSSAFQGDNLRRNLKIVDELKAFATQRGLEVGQLAIAWALARPGVHAAIVGARRPAHIEASIAAADVVLTSDDLAEIDRIAADAVQVAGAAPEGIV
ncbi:aryl-alcohol dehydrogenase-like predicted oxidoreductase [Amycolatopsis lexingtonensis]|uniref:Aryl-alcohol dehydrogenase-like predicted oxidoreductase n=1 Tax=Amycolatopsis lexingtonensis TaxID=218822 RepID=A0ABR9IDJ0_9PSEU|nr:aldo/keto reductase [Amycolatopsis lexingtonensis]MBE1501242.1 aryl-alcohol dehydrogenase-like predicted oxidoreductase [Amycolatopsis lexingtonensis]